MNTTPRLGSSNNKTIYNEQSFVIIPFQKGERLMPIVLGLKQNYDDHEALAQKI